MINSKEAGTALESALGTATREAGLTPPDSFTACASLPLALSEAVC
jgi:hypothetical protein